MVEYKLVDHNGFYYDHYNNNTIGIGKGDFYKLSENEFSNYLSDAITHEYIHHLMHKYFSNTMSTLFDAIGHHFRNMSLLHKMINRDMSVTHDDSIKEHGIKHWLNQRYIDINAFERNKNKSCVCKQKNNMWIEIFGMYYLYRFMDEDHTKVLRFNGSLFVQLDYLQEL